MSEPRRRDEGAWLEVGRLAELGLLSATLVHELRQPLFALKALLQIQARDSGDPATRAALATALEQVDRVERILSTQGGLVQRAGDQAVPFAVEEPLRAALATLEVRARRQGVACTLDLAPDLPIVRGSPWALQQVVVNLLLNALDALEGSPGGRIRVAAAPEEDGVRVTVEDDGLPIPAGDLPRVFDPWFTTKPPGKGTGLGLAIARRIVEAAGGRIEVASRPGSTVFTVHHPLQARAERT